MFIDFTDRGTEREKSQSERETSVGCLPHAPGQDRTQNLGTWSDRESNLRPFDARDDAPTN